MEDFWRALLRGLASEDSYGCGTSFLSVIAVIGVFFFVGLLIYTSFG